MIKHHILESCHRAFYSFAESNRAFLKQMYGDGSIEVMASAIPRTFDRREFLTSNGVSDEEMGDFLARIAEYELFSSEEMRDVQAQRFALSFEGQR